MRDFHKPGRSAVFALNGLCATSHPLAAQAAVEILQRGGNAMDAALAGATILGLAEPAMTGLGGDCFALVSPAGGDEVIAVNGSGRAPMAASAEALRAAGHDTVPPTSAFAVTIPGAVDAFCTMSDTWGRLGLSDCLAPAIRYMDEGVPVAPRVAFDWMESSAQLQGDARRHFLNDGAVPRVGDIFRLPGNAEVLRRIATQGRDGFYSGEVAEDMCAALNAGGGAHTLDDFAATACTIGAPLSGGTRDANCWRRRPMGKA